MSGVAHLASRFDFLPFNRQPPNQVKGVFARMRIAASPGTIDEAMLRLHRAVADLAN